jgi:hypothetical protein
MSKIDLLILLIIYLLHMTHLLLLLYSTYSTRIYNYWLNTNHTSALYQDSPCWAIYIFSSLSCFLLQGLHIILMLIVCIVQLFPFWSLISFWPRLYFLILTDLNYQTLLQMLMDPWHRAPVPHSRARISCSTWWQYISKGKINITPMRLKNCVNSTYKSHGAYAHLGNCTNESAEIVKSSTEGLFIDDPLWLLVPYTYFAAVTGEPPDNALKCLLALMGIIVIFVVVVGSCALKIYPHKATSCDSPSRRPTRISLATLESQEDTNISFSIDSDGLLFIINNSTTCIICNN